MVVATAVCERRRRGEAKESTAREIENAQLVVIRGIILLRCAYLHLNGCAFKFVSYRIALPGPTAGPVAFS